jgi:hypothetical protein
MPWFLYSSACVAIPGPMTQATSPTAAQKPSIPPLALSQAQRARTRQAVRSEDTEVSFALKPAKGAESFEPSVGAKVPNTLKLHPLPADLSNATLEALCIHQIQAPGADCDTDDAQDRRHVSACRLRPNRSTDHAMTMSNSRRAASRHSLSNAGRLSRPLAPLMPWSR